MAKRLKQASLFETLAKKKCDLSLLGTSMECHSSDEEIVMESAMESENYPLDSEVLVNQHECESLCCTSAKPFQPLKLA